MRFSRIIFLFLFLLPLQNRVYSQIGIGNTSPDASSILDITSTTQGVLVPRMSTAQRNVIASPAEGLLVFDIDEDVFYYFDSTVWVPLEGAEKRDNYKLIKSDADLAVELANGGGTEYLLAPGTLYEINGTITLAVPINLNEAYIVGEDTNEDVLQTAGGTIFLGSSGGSIKGVTLVAPGGTVFNLTGSGTESLVFRDSVVVNSGSVGSISSFNLVFISIVQYVGNTSGITFTDIDQVLLNNEGWGRTNGGTYETFVGDFDIITKQGGFSNVTTATAAMDITAITSISGGAGLSIVDFYGGGNYINGTSPYIGYKFTNDWDVNSPGIRVETDETAIGDANLNFSTGTGSTTSFSGNSIPNKIQGTTVSNNLFRFSRSGNNRLVYEGKQTRYFTVTASVSFQGGTNSAGDTYVFYVAKGDSGDVVASPVLETGTARQLGTSNDIGAVAVVGTVQLSPGDFVELWVENYFQDDPLFIASIYVVIK